MTGQVTMESLLKDLVEANIRIHYLESREFVPRTISVKRENFVAKLKTVEESVIAKHKEAVEAWQKATDLYVENVRTNPGAQNIRSPGERPRLTGVEGSRGLVRALECLTDEYIVMEREQFFRAFSEGANAIEAMRGLRDQYITVTSGSVSMNTVR